MSFVLSPVVLNTPTTPSHHRAPSPTPSPPAAHPRSPRLRPGKGLLVPTDRYRDELEEVWLPRLGKLKVESEVTLQGYSLYLHRPWFLSRMHWSQTIVTYTGKPTEYITAYLLYPDDELSDQAGDQALDDAIYFLANETHSQQKKTEHGILLVASPAGYGQDVSPVAGGDLREAKPYMIVTTALRRLGCGGRAAMGMEPALPPIRRKFHDLYRLPTPTAATPTSPTTNQGFVSSPTRSRPAPLASTGDALSQHPILQDPFTTVLLELVKLIQSALALWGMYGSTTHEVELDGLFCDETKAGIFQWRREIGMEHEESLKLEKETSGGCIDPKTLAALLSSVTSVRYQLAQLGVEKLPKDPFTSIRRFLITWQQWQISIGRPQFPHLSETAIRTLHSHFLNERTRHPTDALKVHRLLLSGVAQATSSISHNLKGGVNGGGEDGAPLRKREHHLRFKGIDSGGESEGDMGGFGSSGAGGQWSGQLGNGSILTTGDIGPVAPPDIITTDLEAYIKGVLKSREKDWDIMGSRRIGELWSGQVGSGKVDGQDHRKRHSKLTKARDYGFGAHGRSASRDILREDEEEESAGGARGAFRGMTAKTGQALKGVGALVTRRNTAYETSDSDAGPGPSSRNYILARRKQSAVPMLIEPDVEEVDEILDRNMSASPSPSAPTRHLNPEFGTNSKASFLSVTSRANSKRPSIVTSLSNDGSERSGQGADLRRSFENRNGGPPRGSDWELLGDKGMIDRAIAWRERGRATTMLRTASDGADVVVEEDGLEWEVVEGHGTGRGQRTASSIGTSRGILERRHSLEDRIAYHDMMVSHPDHLAIDVEMASIVLELRNRERKLAERVRQMKTLEDSIFQASSYVIDALRSRRTHLRELDEKATTLEDSLQKTLEDDNKEYLWANKKIQFFLSEDMSVGEIGEGMRELEKDYEGIKGRLEARRKEVEDGSLRKGGWWRFGL